MSVIADLLVKISGDSSGLRKELNAVQRQIKTAFGSDAVAASQKSLSSLKYLTAGFVGAGVAAVKFAADMEQTTMAFETLLGSSEAAKSMVKDLTDFAARTPFQLPGISKSTQQILAYGFAADSVIPMLTSVGDAASSLGGSDETMQSIIRALGQMQAKAKVSAEEMKQLGEQGINAWKYLSEASGKSIAETQELAKKGVFNAEATIKVILDGMNRQFKGGMEKQSQTINGLLSTIQDNAVGAAREIGNSISEALDLKDRLKEAGAYLTEFTKLAENAGIKTALKEMVPESVKLGVIGLASAFTGRLIPALYIAALNSVKTNSTMLRMMETTTLLGLAIAELSGVTNVMGPMGDSFLQSGVAAITAYKSISMLSSGYSWFLGEISAAYGPLNKTNTIVAQMAQAFMFARIKIVSTGGAMAALKGTVYGLAAAFKSLAIAMGPVGWMALAVGGGVWLGMRAQMAETERQAALTEAAIKKVNGEFANADSSAVQKAIQASEKKLVMLEAEAKKASAAMGEISKVRVPQGKSKRTVKNVENIQNKDKSALAAARDVQDQIQIEKDRQKELTELYKQRKEIEDQLKKAGNIGNVKVPDLLGAGDEDEKAKKKREAELKRLREEAKRTSESIEDEWIQMTGTKMDVLDKWKSDEIAALDKTKSVNGNYQRDLTRLEETYSEKRRLILHEEAKEKQRTIQEITTGYAELFNNLNAGGLKGTNKDLYEMTRQARDDYKGATDFFAKINSEYADGTKEQKRNIIEALEAAGVAYKKVGQDGLDFTQSLYDYELERFKQLQDEKLDYYRQCKGIQAEIDEAYTQSSLEKLQEALTTENVLRLNNYDAMQSMMSTYEEARRASLATTAQLWADVYATAFDGVSSSISDFFMGVSTAEEALKSFGKSLLQVVVDFYAKKVAGMLMEGIIGKSAIAAQTAASVAAGAATAAAWAPAAAAVSLASFGANSAPAMAGISATHALSSMLSAVPGLAKGGPVFGAGTATSDSVPAMLSNGEYVMKASAVDRLGLGFLNRLNSGKMPALSEGGLVTGPPLASVGVPSYAEPAGQETAGGGIGKKEAVETVAEQQPSVNMSVYAMDAKSFGGWLEDTGGKPLRKFMKDLNREFAALG